MNTFCFSRFFSVSLLLSILLLNCFFIKKNSSQEIDETGEDGITSLMMNNFESFINDDDRYTLLVVYAPWCHWSSMLLIDLEKISILLKHDEHIKIAKVNAVINTQIMDMLNVFTYPALFMIKKNNKHKFTGVRTIKNIILWVYETQKDESVYEMKDIDKLENYIKNDENDNSIVFFVSRNDEDEALLKFLNGICLEIHESFCFYIKKKEVIDYLENVIMSRKNYTLGLKEKQKKIYTILYKNNSFDEYFHVPKNDFDVIYDSATSHEDQIKVLKEFILENTEPLVIQFSEIYFNILFHPNAVTLFIIYNNIHELNKTDIINAAQKYKKKVIFAISGSNEVFEKRLLSELIIEEVNKPIMRIIEFKESVDIPLKYKPISDDIELNEQNIVEFIEGFLNGRKYFYRKSEKPLPDEINNGYVKIVVADNYDDYIFKSDKHVLMLYYAPWCGHCRKFEPVYRELGKRLSIYSSKFKDYKNDIIISKIDAANNEIYNITLDGYPSLYLYEKSDKQHPIKYNGDRSVQDILSWISENTSSNIDITKMLNLDLDDEKLFENYEEL